MNLNDQFDKFKKHFSNQLQYGVVDFTQEERPTARGLTEAQESGEVTRRWFGDVAGVSDWLKIGNLDILAHWALTLVPSEN